MVRAVKIKIRKLTPGRIVPGHVEAIVAGALGVARNRRSFDFKLIETSPQPANAKRGSWAKQGDAMVHGSWTSRWVSAPAPATALTGRWQRGGMSEAAD